MMANAIQMVSPTLCFVSLAAYVSDLATATLSEPILIVVEGPQTKACLWGPRTWGTLGLW